MCMSDVVICSKSISSSLPCMLSQQPWPFIPLAQLFGLFWTPAGVLGAGSMLSGGLFAVSWDETGGQLEGPIFLCVHEWTLVNHLMRAGGTPCLLSPLWVLSPHTFTHKDELFLTLALCILKMLKHTASGNVCLFFYILNPLSCLFTYMSIIFYL